LSEHRPIYRRTDPVNGVECSAGSYPYGGNHPGRGLQLTLVKDLTVLATRLPVAEALKLAQAILAELDADADDDDDRESRITNHGPLLTPGEVAASFHVDPKTVTRWARAGRLSAIRTLGGHRRYRESEIRALLDGDEP
jgi:excisionase family DNA binding protein